MMFKIFSLFFILTFFGNTESKIYVKNYHPNGKIKEEGWLIDGQKNEYWFFYYDNGNKKCEGHFKNDKRVKWWIHYNEDENVLKKSEYKNDKLNGVTIIYDNGSISRAEKYVNGKHVKTWTTISEFKKDNGNWF